MEVFWSNLSLTVADRFQWKHFLDRKQKTIFKDLSGSCQPGQVTAILGPSGCGKTSLLKVIVSKCINTGQGGTHFRHGSLSGSITITSEDESEDTSPQARIAFIQQDDTLLGGLTVWETLWYASKLINYGRFAYTSEHAETVQRVVDDLQLNTCLNSLVAYCSGGERRRLSVGLELLRRPDILVADEITSGLDSSSAAMLVRLMKMVSRADVSSMSSSHVSNEPESIATSETTYPMTVIMTIHQPSGRVFQMFDSVYLMGLAENEMGRKHGVCLYRGPPHEMVPTLEACNVTIPLYSNPCDTVLDVAACRRGQDVIKTLVDRLQEETQSVNHQKCVTFTQNTGHSWELMKFPTHVTHLLTISLLENLRNPTEPLALTVIFICLPLIFTGLLGRYGTTPDCNLPDYEQLGSNTTSTLAFKMADTASGMKPSLTAAYVTFFAMALTIYCFIVLRSPLMRSVVSLLRRDVTNGRHGIAAWETSRLLFSLILSLYLAVLNVTCSVLIQEYYLSMDGVWKLLIAMVGVFVFANEFGHIIALLVATRSVHGAIVLATSLGSLVFYSGDTFSVSLRLRNHELDSPNANLVLADNSFVEHYLYTLNSVYYGPDACRDQLVTNVTTDMVSEYDPASGVGLPYNHFHVINPNSYLLSYVFMGVMFIGMKGLSVWLIKLRCQF